MLEPPKGWRPILLGILDPPRVRIEEVRQMELKSPTIYLTLSSMCNFATYSSSVVTISSTKLCMGGNFLLEAVCQNKKVRWLIKELLLFNLIRLVDVTCHSCHPLTRDLILIHLVSMNHLNLFFINFTNRIHGSWPEQHERFPKLSIYSCVEMVHQT